MHLELADSLETDDFILVLRSFIARRGQLVHMYSDNGTNFQGANNELSECLKNFNKVKVCDFLTPKGIQWHFNPPQSPHFGGAWERLVRSTKRALQATIQNQCVPESVLRTALIEVEALLNSRPLTHNNCDPADFTALTPYHFLIGRISENYPPDLCDSLETDDFILVLRSFIARRGQLVHMYSDNGTNFQVLTMSSVNV